MTTPKKNGVVAVLQNAAGEYLFIRRGLTLKRAPGVWCFVGGEVEPGEPFDAAIAREVFEEVGLHIKPLSKVFESISPNGEYLLHWYRVEMLNPAEVVNASPVEVAEYRWLSLDDALTLDPILPTLHCWLQTK